MASTIAELLGAFGEDNDAPTRTVKDAYRIINNTIKNQKDHTGEGKRLTGKHKEDPTIKTVTVKPSFEQQPETPSVPNTEGVTDKTDNDKKYEPVAETKGRDEAYDKETAGKEYDIFGKEIVKSSTDLPGVQESQLPLHNIEHDNKASTKPANGLKATENKSGKTAFQLEKEKKVGDANKDVQLAQMRKQGLKKQRKETMKANEGARQASRSLMADDADILSYIAGTDLPEDKKDEFLARYKELVENDASVKKYHDALKENAAYANWKDAKTQIRRRNADFKNALRKSLEEGNLDSHPAMHNMFNKGSFKLEEDASGTPIVTFDTGFKKLIKAINSGKYDAYGPTNFPKLAAVRDNLRLINKELLNKENPSNADKIYMNIFAGKQPLEDLVDYSYVADDEGNKKDLRDLVKELSDPKSEAARDLREAHNIKGLRELINDITGWGAAKAANKDELAQASKELQNAKARAASAANMSIKSDDNIDVSDIGGKLVNTGMKNITDFIPGGSKFYKGGNKHIIAVSDVDPYSYKPVTKLYVATKRFATPEAEKAALAGVPPEARDEMIYALSNNPIGYMPGSVTDNESKLRNYIQTLSATDNQLLERSMNPYYNSTGKKIAEDQLRDFVKDKALGRSFMDTNLYKELQMPMEFRPDMSKQELASALQAAVDRLYKVKDRTGNQMFGVSAADGKIHLLKDVDPNDLVLSTAQQEGLNKRVAMREKYADRKYATVDPETGVVKVDLNVPNNTYQRLVQMQGGQTSKIWTAPNGKDDKVAQEKLKSRLAKGTLKNRSVNSNVQGVDYSKIGETNATQCAEALQVMAQVPAERTASNIAKVLSYSAKRAAGDKLTDTAKLQRGIQAAVKQIKNRMPELDPKIINEAIGICSAGFNAAFDIDVDLQTDYDNKTNKYLNNATAALKSKLSPKALADLWGR